MSLVNVLLNTAHKLLSCTQLEITPVHSPDSIGPSMRRDVFDASLNTKSAALTSSI